MESLYNFLRIAILFIIVLLFLCHCDMNENENDSNSSSLNLGQYPKYSAYIDCYELYSYPKYGIYVFYAKEGNKHSHKFDTLNVLAYEKPWSEFKNKHIYVFDFIPDLSEINQLKNPMPFDIVSRLKKQKPAIWSLSDEYRPNFKDKVFICDRNEQGEYNLYSGYDFMELKFNSKEVIKYCNTNY